MIWGLNLPGTPRAISACRGTSFYSACLPAFSLYGWELVLKIKMISPYLNKTNCGAIPWNRGCRIPSRWRVSLSHLASLRDAEWEKNILNYSTVQIKCLAASHILSLLTFVISEVTCVVQLLYNSNATFRSLCSWVRLLRCKVNYTHHKPDWINYATTFPNCL
jgi:hypothetical protein